MDSFSRARPLGELEREKILAAAAELCSKAMSMNGQRHETQISFGMMLPSSSMHESFSTTGSKVGAYEMGELDQALFMYLDGQTHSSVEEQRQTLNIFPSQPMHVEPSTKVGLSLVSPPSNAVTRVFEPFMELGNPSGTEPHAALTDHSAKGGGSTTVVKREGSRRRVATASSSDHEGPKTPDPKTLRRLAQNREAARKSRLRKKAYVQQLESSRIKLTQIEQELQRARTQGLFFGGGSLLVSEQSIPQGLGGGGVLSSEATIFDMEYGRWLEEHHRLIFELRAAVQEHLPESELRLYVDNCLAHHDELAILKAATAKSDVFHLLSGIWKTPAERCFMWMGGFRPSDLIKVLLSHLEPLTEQQILGVCALQQSTQETEEALTQGLEALHQSLSETMASDSPCHSNNIPNYMGQMAVGINKLSTLEGFLKQGDNLRHQTLHRLHQILTTRQAARCFLAMAEYFHRLRALSSLWLARPRQDQ